LPAAQLKFSARSISAADNLMACWLSLGRKTELGSEPRELAFISINHPINDPGGPWHAGF